MRLALLASAGFFALMTVLCLVAAIASVASGSADGVLRNASAAAAFAVIAAFWVVVAGEHRRTGSLLSTTRVRVMCVVAFAALVAMIAVFVVTG